MSVLVNTSGDLCWSIGNGFTVFFVHVTSICGYGADDVCQVEVRDRSPERAWEDGKWVNIAVVGTFGDEKRYDRDEC